MWGIVWVSPQGHRSVSASRHFILQAPQCPCSVQKWFNRDHCCQGRSKPSCQIVGSHSRWELTTWADFQLCFHRLLTSVGEGNQSSSSCMHVMNHNWSATKQRLYLQSVAEISRYSVLSRDRIWQCGTSSGSLHKDTDQCLQVAISFCRHRSVPVSCENGSVETTVAEGGENLVAGLWGPQPPHIRQKVSPLESSQIFASVDK